jgi:hypothetical protein
MQLGRQWISTATRCTASAALPAGLCGILEGMFESALLRRLSEVGGSAAASCLHWLVYGEMPSSAERIDVVWPREVTRF